MQECVPEDIAADINRFRNPSHKCWFIKPQLRLFNRMWWWHVLIGFYVFDCYKCESARVKHRWDYCLWNGCHKFLAQP